MRCRSPIAVIVDAFGTLLQIRAGHHPYRQLIQMGIAHGRRPQPRDLHVILQEPLTLTATAERLGIRITATELASLEAQLAEDVSQIEPFSDALQAVHLLRAAGINVAVCSNLAWPYTQAVERCFPDLNAYFYSCTLGVMKPHPGIYAHVCQALGRLPAETVMIGDSLTCDCAGPRQAGLHGYHLKRDGAGGDFADMVSFARRVLDAPESMT